MRLALAASTRKAYDRSVEQFTAFREQVGLADLWPIPVEHLMQFCVELKGKGLVVKTIRAKLAALAFTSKVRGLSDSSGDFRLRKMLEGWSREQGPRSDPRTPFSPEVLKGFGRIWPTIRFSEFEALLFQAAAMAAFFGALRVSELVVSSRNDSSGRALLMGDVKIVGDCVTIRVRRSKTDQRHKGVTITLGSCHVSEICPVLALKGYISVRGDDPGPFFRHEDGSPLTKFQFWSVTSQALVKLGLSGFRFGTHSFRIGAASTAAAMGYPGPAIQHVGRWRSSAYKSYVRPMLHDMC
ncbi:integrase/recombinase xerD homolog [Heteronotia binoei]|uniref:integrase/recombinase xerD homolog n=1 Tax=Heteronotia binoei TaxID=13085 RepID=UPI00292E487B|nr:integrase/recombinase xerD homolog [Heteronotia binoei]